MRSARPRFPPRAAPLRQGAPRRWASSSTASAGGGPKSGEALPGGRVPSPQTHFILTVIAWVPVALFITGHVASIATVSGTSMTPTFNPVEMDITPVYKRTADVVLLNRLVTATRDYRVGDIVTLYSPSDPQSLITKRILALGGDTVKLWVPHEGGEPAAPSSEDDAGIHSMAYTDIYHRALRAIATSAVDHATGTWLTITIPPNYAWIEGDASAAAPQGGTTVTRPELKSRDSREFGPVPIGLITARISCILWPPSRFGPPAARPSKQA